MIPQNQSESIKPITGARPSVEDEDTPSDPAPSAERPATVIVRGEAVTNQKTPPTQSSSAQLPSVTKGKVSEDKLQMRSRLPALDDDGNVGVEKGQLVTRDGKADLTFTGTLLASAAEGPTTKESWEEYRIYETSGGKHVFSKLTRSVLADEPDSSEAEIFDPSPSSVPSQLLRSARELTRSRPVEWTDAAVSFFGYNALAKVLYRKIGDQFNEHIS